MQLFYNSLTKIKGILFISLFFVLLLFIIIVDKIIINIINIR